MIQLVHMNSRNLICLGNVRGTHVHMGLTYSCCYSDIPFKYESETKIIIKIKVINKSALPWVIPVQPRLESTVLFVFIKNKKKQIQRK